MNMQTSIVDYSSMINFFIINRCLANGEIAKYVEQGHRHSRLFERTSFVCRNDENDQRIFCKVANALEALNAGHPLPRLERDQVNMIQMLGLAIDQKQQQQLKNLFRKWMESGDLRPLIVGEGRNAENDKALAALTSIGQWGDVGFFKEFLSWMGSLEKLEVADLQVYMSPTLLLPLTWLEHSLPCFNYFKKWMETHTWGLAISPPETLENALKHALSHGNFVTAQSIIDNDWQNNVPLDKDFLAYHYIQRCKHTELNLLSGLSFLMKNGESLTGAKNSPYVSPLTAICSNEFKEKDQFKIIDLLLEHGYDINECSNFVNTPLAVAALDLNLELVDYLLKKGADVHQSVTTDSYPIVVRICEELNNNKDEFREMFTFFLSRGDSYSQQVREATEEKVHPEFRQLLNELWALYDQQELSLSTAPISPISKGALRRRI